MASRSDDVEVVARALRTLVEGARRGMSQSFDLNRLSVLATAAQGGLRPIDIAERLDLYPSSVTRHIQALIEAGHLRVVEDRDDRRSSPVLVTDAGREELRRHEQAGIDVLAGVLAEWAHDDIRTLGTLLDRLSASWAERGAHQKARVRRGRRDRLPHWVYDSDRHPAGEPPSTTGNAGGTEGGTT